jgi:hypothetical protein
MKPLNALTGGELLWKQAKFGADHFELIHEETRFAELTWTRLLSDEAVARTAGGWWTFDRLGCLRGRVVATVAESEQVAASFEFDWLKNGTLQLANGRTFEWYRTRTFANAWALAEAGGTGFLEIEHGFHWFSQRAWVTLHFPAGDPDLPLLLCLAMYLVYCINQDMAGAVAATTAVFG